MTGFRNPQILSVREAAAILRVSHRWLYARARLLPHMRCGSRIRFDLDALIAHLQLLARRNNLPAAETAEAPHGGVMALGLKRYQRGHIYKDGKGKKMWRAMWREDRFDAAGKLFRVRRTCTIGSLAEIPTLTEARRKLEATMQAPAASRLDLSFSDLVSRWRAALLPALRTSTGNYYRTIIDAHLLPAFGERKIAGIGRHDAQLFLSSKAGQYSRNSLRGMRIAMGRLFSWAVECGWLSENPCKGLRIPQGRPGRERHRLTFAETVALASALKEPYATLVLLLATTGLRISEALGLRWGDLSGEELIVSRRVYEGSDGELKTASSRRRVRLQPLVLNRLATLRKGDGYVFQTRRGTPLWPKNAMNRHVRPAAKDLGIPLTGWHDFRHALVTWLAEQGVSAKVAAAICGHANIRTTLAVYTHTKDAQADAALGLIGAQLANDGKLREFSKPQTTMLQ